MYYAEKEIFSQFEAIDRTTNYLKERKEEVIGFFQDAKKVIFVGSGSSYSIAKSAAAITGLRSDAYSMAVAAGDILVNFEQYERVVEDSVVVSISRSGSTSELLFAIKMAKEEVNCKVVSVCAKEESDIEKYTDVNMIIPWAFDKSVCQTRTVANLYAACVMLISFIAGDTVLEDEMLNVTQNAKSFQSKYVETLSKVGELNFDHGVVLGECEIAGIAEEAALAFKEICQINSNHYPVLDVRHGPMVMINSNSLVILNVKEMNQHIVNLVRDIKAKGAYCITMGMFEEDMGGDLHIDLPKFENMAVAATYMLFCIQVITLRKAISSGINPDEPDGLDAWIKL